MSCPDWRALAAARGSDSAVDLPAWVEARRHAAECPHCRSAAFAAEPLLLFDRLPERTVTPDEIADMQAAVGALVRASRIGRGGQGVARPVPAASGRRSLSRLVAALGVCSLLALSGAPRPHSRGFAELAELAAEGSALQGLEAVFEGASPVQSAVEELDRPGVRIYELPQADMAVVMIVDASLDV